MLSAALWTVKGTSTAYAAVGIINRILMPIFAQPIFSFLRFCITESTNSMVEK